MVTTVAGMRKRRCGGIFRRGAVRPDGAVGYRRELPARQRTIFNLKIYESRSNQEIADMLNVSVNTVKVHYARTMKHLCQRLKKN